MNVAKWLLLTLLALPLLELAVFVAVAATIGFGWAFSLVVATSIAGLLVLRHAGGSHLVRIRAAVDRGSFAALEADNSGGFILLAGILLLIPGFITDIVALVLLMRAASATLRGGTSPSRNDGIVDLPSEQWHQIPDPSLPDRHRDERQR